LKTTVRHACFVQTMGQALHFFTYYWCKQIRFRKGHRY